MKYVLFDLDGTLVDSSAGIFRCFAYAFEKTGVATPPQAVLRTFIGPPLLQSFLETFGGDEARALEGVKRYRERYDRVGWTECTLYPHVRECLAALATDKKLALATSKPQCFAERILESNGLSGYFSAVVGSKEDNSFDDKARIIKKALNELRAQPAQAVMVGDRRHDADGAQANGVRAVAVRTGFAPAGELERAPFWKIVEDFYGLEQLLLGEKGKKRTIFVKNEKSFVFSEKK